MKFNTHTERAIQYFQAQILEDVGSQGYSRFYYYDLAIESLEKQMPKTIDIYDYGKAHCPKCKTDVHGIGKIGYCFKCGQRLDWNLR